MTNLYDVIVIGAGVIGANVARELSSYNLRVLVLEKETDVCGSVSMANSAIVHSGYDPVPNSKKAVFNVRGNAMFDDLCKRLDVEFSRIGSLTIAMSDEDLNVLKSLEKRANENNVKVQLLNHDELMKIEPNISPLAKGALLAPTAGIINPFTFVARNIENALDNGVTLHLNEEVSEVRDANEFLIVITNKNRYHTKVVINCAGHGAYDIASRLETLPYEINPRKGEYFVLDHFAPGFVNHTIFPLPSKKGKGILITPTYSGNYMIGPSSELSPAHDTTTDTLTLNNVKSGALQLVPSIPFGELIRVFSGVRPTPSDHDFHIEPLSSHPNFINLCGIESPGFASSPAIAKYVVEELLTKLIKLEKNPNYNPNVRKHINTRFLSSLDRANLVKEHPEYGEIICQCERVSLGEILDVLSRSDHPKTIKAVKKRVRAGFGKCQGGFCQPLVAKIIADFYHISILDVLYSSKGSNILKCATKENDND